MFKVICYLIGIGITFLFVTSVCAKKPDKDKDKPLKNRLDTSTNEKEPRVMSIEELDKVIEILKPLHKKLGKPREGDWLTLHQEEPGQSFREYLKCNPVKPQGKRNKIYIQPLGNFNEIQEKIIQVSADFVKRYFNLEVKTTKRLDLSIIPKNARRVHPAWRDNQILTTYILNNVLKPRLPEDAAVYIAFTTSDLWPGGGWNFVFGQASLHERVGVWSIYRYGDPGRGKERFKKCLLRTIKTATHEIGHMFTMQHCVEYECNMCGSNSLDESDRRPIWLCPECMAKICWVTKISPLKRYEKLLEFFRKHTFKDEAEFIEKSIKKLKRNNKGN